jgi:glycerol-3-phosphate acyltransferase PlsX
MRIGVDVMGGDHAPHPILEGALSAIQHLPDEDTVVLFGDQSIIEQGVADSGVDASRVEIVGTTEEISMDESPVDAVRQKQDSSLVQLCKWGSKKADNPIDAVISAGNTGAFVAASQMYLRRLPSVHRPGIAAAVPTFAGTVCFIDVGANIEPKPLHLAQYGVMGKVYANRILGIENPRVALMNVGGEEQKGTSDLKDARDMLRDADDVNFIGYIEGRTLFDGGADVVITDGIVGNVSIKLAEGLATGLITKLASEIMKADPELAEAFKPIIKKFYSDYDYHEYGGAPLLGVNGISMITHGSAEARTIENAVRRTRQFVDFEVNKHIVEQLSAIEERIAVG